MQYDIDRYPVGVVGGFGYANRNILRKVAEPYGIRFSTIIAAPIEGFGRVPFRQKINYGRQQDNRTVIKV